jgi:hypothetical protein
MEKLEVLHNEKGTLTPDSTPTPPSEYASFDAKATKRLLRKIDLILIPFLALLYL